MTAPTYIGKPCKRGHGGRRYANGNCVQCLLGLSAKRLKENPEKERLRSAARRRADPTGSRAYMAAYRVQNLLRMRAFRTKWSKANPEKLKACRSAWTRANLDKVRLLTAGRRARKHDAPGRGISAQEWEEVRAGAIGLCAYCARPMPLTLDHIDPLARGGAHDADNATTACQPCNSSKADKPLLLWLAGG